MQKLYSWHDVAKRTEIVYERALGCPDQSLLERLSRYVIRTTFCLDAHADALASIQLHFWPAYVATLLVS